MLNIGRQTSWELPRNASLGSNPLDFTAVAQTQESAPWGRAVASPPPRFLRGGGGGARRLVVVMVVLAGAVEGAICFFSLLPAAACRSSLPLCLLACCCVVLPAGGPPPPARRCCCVIFVHSRYAQVYFRPSHPATKNGLQLSTSSMMCAVCCSLLICCAACANLTCYLPRKNVKSAHQQIILCPLKFSFSVSIFILGVLFYSSLTLSSE